jgi:SAM-dependent methyltransferase
LLAGLAEGGVVYALDACPDSLHALEGRAGHDAWLVTLCCQYPPAPLESASLDLIWGANVLHELGNTAIVLAEVMRLLRPGGRVVMVDWDRVESPRGPKVEHRIAASDAASRFSAAGFVQISVGPCKQWKYWIKEQKP